MSQQQLQNVVMSFRQRFLKWSAVLIVPHIYARRRATLYKESYKSKVSCSRRQVQWRLVAVVPEVCICAMLKEGLSDF